MATVAPSTRKRMDSQMARDVIVTWNLTQANNDGAWFGSPGIVLRAYSVSGIFGAAGSVALKASCFDAPGVGGPPVLTGAMADESAITGAGAITAAGTVTNGQYTAAASYRPLLTGGDGTTALAVIMYFVAD